MSGPFGFLLGIVGLGISYALARTWMRGTLRERLKALWPKLESQNIFS